MKLSLRDQIHRWYIILSYKVSKRKQIQHIERAINILLEKEMQGCQTYSVCGTLLRCAAEQHGSKLMTNFGIKSYMLFSYHNLSTAIYLSKKYNFKTPKVSILNTDQEGGFWWEQSNVNVRVLYLKSMLNEYYRK